MRAYGWFVCCWVLLVSFQYGYHISALNQIQFVLTDVIPMDHATFSLVTAIFTIGGLIGSVAADFLIDRRGRAATVQVSALLSAAGAALHTVANSVLPLLMGRLFLGIAAGIGLCVAPIYLSEIAPPKIRAAVGVLTQLAIVVGILVTQALGIKVATPELWRLVPAVAAVLGVLQLALAPLVVESPVYLARTGRPDAAKAARDCLWQPVEVHLREDDAHDNDRETREDEEADHNPRDAEPLLTPRDAAPIPAVSVPQLLFARELRRPLWIMVLAMLAQQLSGVNAVLYYSTAIFTPVLPDLAPNVSLAITVVNALMTFPPMFLLERLGRKPLLQISVLGAILSHLAVGAGLATGAVGLASVAVATFIMSFAVGLGPIPYVILSEVAPPHGVAAISSVALSMNWFANFIVGLTFLPLRDLLADGDPKKEGRIFFLFAGLLALSAGAFFRMYRG